MLEEEWGVIWQRGLVNSELQTPRRIEDSLSRAVLFLSSTLLLAPSNHLSALLLSPESALLTLGLLLDGEPLEHSVCELVTVFLGPKAWSV